MPYPLFDRSRLHLKPLADRIHDMKLAEVLPLDAPAPAFDDPALPAIAERIIRARQIGAPVILLMGAHVIKVGLSRFVIDLMERGIITHVGMNGAGPIHDFELALIGATTESVARYIQEGQFGLWDETGWINDIVAEGVRDGLGYGEALGRTNQRINESANQRITNRRIRTSHESRVTSHAVTHHASRPMVFPHKDVSILAVGYRLRVPVTVHIGVGQDIIHEHPNCDGAALGEASYRDFLIFTQTVTQLQGGVMLNFGTAVMGPEVYLKALSMARNVAHQEGRQDQPVYDRGVRPNRSRRRSGPRGAESDARDYYRPFKTILVRTVQDGGESFYVRGPHQATLPALHRLVTATMGNGLERTA